MGSSLVIEVNSKTATTDTSSAVSASVEASWSGFGASVSGGAGFSSALSQSSTLSSSTVVVTMSGQDRGAGVSSLSIKDANDQIINFAKYAKHGTGLATVLKRFDRHRDYIATLNKPECSKAGQ